MSKYLKVKTQKTVVFSASVKPFTGAPSFPFLSYGSSYSHTVESQVCVVAPENETTTRLISHSHGAADGCHLVRLWVALVK